MKNKNAIADTIAEITQKNLGSIFGREEIIALAKKHGATWTQISTTLVSESTRCGKGKYNLSELLKLPTSSESSPAPIKESSRQQLKMSAGRVTSIMNEDVFIPEVDEFYVRWGAFEVIERALQSNTFYPIYISGLSGNGKTTMVEQACARQKRHYIRVQINPDTDADDLIGGWRIVDGETVFCKGPVIKAMETGAVLLIDEIDRGSNKIMCLQGILEGKPVLIQKTSEVVYPTMGFTVIATANTKGQGSDDGKFSAAVIIDEAFLERFVATIEQPYPPKHIEKKIILQHMEKFGSAIDEDFAAKLADWSDVIHRTYEEQAIDEVISTRRLCHITQTYAIFNDKMKAINMCIARFSTDTKNAFADLYTKLDASVMVQQPCVILP